jgi:hypothetical protein
MAKQVSLAPKRSQTSQRMICAWNKCAQKGDKEDSGYQGCCKEGSVIRKNFICKDFVRKESTSQESTSQESTCNEGSCEEDSEESGWCTSISY